MFRALAVFLKSLVVIFLSLFVILFFNFFYICVFILIICFSINKAPGDMMNMLYSSASREHASPNFNILILGLDKRNDIFEKTETTDTIMLISINQKTHHLNLFSIPRDLWFYRKNIKINSIYPQALSSNPQRYLSVIADDFSEIIGQKIDRTIIITTNNLTDIANLFGKLPVYLKDGFTDNQYPNPEYIKNPHKPNNIYITVSYPAGWNYLDSKNINPYVRSRKSLIGGTDLGRIKRQQILIESLIGNMKSPFFWLDFHKPIILYRYYHQNIISNLSDEDIFKLLKTNSSNLNQFTINKYEIPVGVGSGDGIIFHPDIFYDHQWVFLPCDQKYLKLHQFITDKIKQ